MKNFLNSKIIKYFFYMLLCVCVFAITYILGSVALDDLFWHKNVEFDSPKPIGGLVMLILLDLVVCFFIWIESDL